MCHLSSRIVQSNGESGTECLNASVNKEVQQSDMLAAIVPMQIDRLELYYPRRLFLGLWRLYSQLVVKMKQSRQHPPILKCGCGCKCSGPLRSSVNGDSLSSPSDSSGECWRGLNKHAQKSSSRPRPFFSSSSSRTIMLNFYILLLVGCVVGCGPGRGAGRRRAPRKLTPLVYKQHVPNVPENTLSASGLNEGKITRDHPRFKNLVPNYNQDIIFRDDEGSGADRLMTQRCKEKLNTLAISVMNQWPGVKLRVIEGWDDENLHATHSLHYEGRAVDITTSDKERSKYGMLARLAVEAGFDWVYYESRAHIHVSVKSDSMQAGRTGGCFSANSTVETLSGPKRMADLEQGDKVLAVDSNGEQIYSDVLLFLDKNKTERRDFYKIQTSSGSSIILTPSHLIYSIQPESLTPKEILLFENKNDILKNQSGLDFLDKAVVSFARNVQIGDWLLVWNNDTFNIEKIIDMEAKIETGVYAPLTSEGNIMVDGILSSCYAVIDDQSLDHWAFLPIRLGHNLLKGVSYLWNKFSRFITFRYHEVEVNSLVGKGESSTRRNDKKSGDQGIHWYAQTLYTVSKYVLPSHLHYGD